MGCSAGVERGAVTCSCSGQIVFEGAAVGQVFTGDVKMQCPLAANLNGASGNRCVEPCLPSRLSDALFAMAIWELVAALSGTGTQDGALTVQVSALAATAMFVRYGLAFAKASRAMWRSKKLRAEVLAVSRKERT